jgi:hypothetical protein
MVYRIDRNYTIVHVDGAFRRFAAAASFPQLPDHVLGRSLWSCIADDERRAVYAALVGRARAGHIVRVQTRWDSPSLIRTVDMEISPLPGGEVEIACAAGSARLASPAPPSDSDLLRICAWCYRVDRGGIWQGIEDVVAEERLLERPTVPIVTHGICDDCLTDAAAQLEPAAARAVRATQPRGRAWSA